MVGRAALRLGDLRHQRMEGRGDRRKVGEGRGTIEAGDIAERAAVAHTGQQQPVGSMFQRPRTLSRMRTRFGVSVSSPISAQVSCEFRSRSARPGWRQAAGVAQPAPQEAAAVAAAAVQRHHQRPGAVGRVIFRHVKREAAAAAGLVVIVDDAGVWRAGASSRASSSASSRNAGSVKKLLTGGNLTARG